MNLTVQATGCRFVKEAGYPIVREQFWLLRNTVTRHVTAVKPSWPEVFTS